MLKMTIIYTKDSALTNEPGKSWVTVCHQAHTDTNRFTHSKRSYVHRLLLFVSQMKCQKIKTLVIIITQQKETEIRIQDELMIV